MDPSLIVWYLVQGTFWVRPATPPSPPREGGRVLAQSGASDPLGLGFDAHFMLARLKATFGSLKELTLPDGTPPVEGIAPGWNDQERHASRQRLAGAILEAPGPLKDKPQLQLPGRLMAATGQIMSPCYQQTVCSAEQPTGRGHDALPGDDCVHCPWITCVCAGGGSCSESFVSTSTLAPDRSP